MISRILGFQIASRDDPLANVKSIRLWAAGLPLNDPVGALDAIIRLLESARAAQPEAILDRLRAMMELDRIAVPLQAQVQAQYRIVAISDAVRQRLWRACDGSAHWFAHLYEEVCRSMLAPGEHKKAHAELHGVFARMLYYIGVEARHGLFRYEQWIPGKWRLLHGVYQEACRQGVAAEPFALTEVTPPADRLSPEQEYLQILLLQRLNTGNLTAQQIDWAAEWLRGWAHLLQLAMTPIKSDGYWLDLGRGEGLFDRRPPDEGGELLYLDVTPLRAQLGLLHRRIVAQAAAKPGQAESEERLALAGRLDRLWLPQATEQARRGERRPVHRSVAVAAGWTEVSITMAPKLVKKTGAPQGYYFDDYGRLRQNSTGEPGQRELRKVEPDQWEIHDSSDSGFRIRSSSPHASRQRPGALLGLLPEGHPGWQIAIVRRLRRLGAEQTELGVEIICLDPALITAKEMDVRDTGYSVDGIDIGLKDKGFHAIYLPPQSCARATALASLLLPPAEFTAGRMLSLLIDGQRQAVCLAMPLERTKDWVWALLESAP